jgi:hypothetical protein
MVRRKNKAPYKKASPKKATQNKTNSYPTDMINPQLQWEAYKTIERQINAAWAKLQNDVKRRAPQQTLLEDKNQLMLLLGECNYMARECVRWIDHLPKEPKKGSKRV